MSDPRPMVHIRLPRELLRAVDHWAIDAGEERPLDRARAIERLIRSALTKAEPEVQG